MSMWDSMTTNKKVAGMWPNDADGNAWADPELGFPAVLPQNGYEVVYAGGYQNGTEDYTAIITDIKKAGCRDPKRCPRSARLPGHVEPDASAGLQPSRSHCRKGVVVPARYGSHRPRRLRFVDRGVVDAAGILSSLRSPGRLARSLPTISRRRQDCSGRNPCSTMACSRSWSTLSSGARTWMTRKLSWRP